MADNYRQEDSVKQEQQEIQRMAQTVTQVINPIVKDVSRWTDNNIIDREYDIEWKW